MCRAVGPNAQRIGEVVETHPGSTFRDLTATKTYTQIWPSPPRIWSNPSDISTPNWVDPAPEFLTHSEKLLRES